MDIAQCIYFLHNPLQLKNLVFCTVKTQCFASLG